MKKLYFLGSLCVFSMASAQNISFTDPNIKDVLLGVGSGETNTTDINGVQIDIDLNNDNEISISEAQLVYGVSFMMDGVSDFTGLELFGNLQRFHAEFSDLTSFNLQPMPSLQSLILNNNSLTSLDLTGFPNLKIFMAEGNQLSSLNLSGLELQTLHVTDNQLTTISAVMIFDPSDTTVASIFEAGGNNLETVEISGSVDQINLYGNNLQQLDLTNVSFGSVWFDGNPNLNFINIKDGLNGILDPSLVAFALQGDFSPNASPVFICADDGPETDFINEFVTDASVNWIVNSYCSFHPGGTTYNFSGAVTFDAEANGCDTSDPGFGNFPFALATGSGYGAVFTSGSGAYDFNVNEGSYTISPQLENPSFFNISPAGHTVTFGAGSANEVQDFCVTANGTHNDIEVAIIPITPAIPGFNANYKLVYRNKGTMTVSGNVTTSFDDSITEVISATPAIDNQMTNSISWNYANLQPMEAREVLFTLHVNSPTDSPAVDGGDIIHFLAGVFSGVIADENPSDNLMYFEHLVVNSFDPNDKTCLEGPVVSADKIGEYVHYVIRFENTGTANAQNIVVRDDIDPSKYDITSLIPLSGSHDYFTRVTENRVEFVFEGIQLPFDDASNDGYVAFKIKTLPTLVVGDTFSNFAGIYFDYNFPIITETASTLIEQLSVSGNDFSKDLRIYPNPATNQLRFATATNQTIDAVEVFSVSGQLLMQINHPGVHGIDVSHLASGSYFAKVRTAGGTAVAKFVKQ